MQMNEALASYLQEGRLEEADKLDAEMIQYCGTDGRVVINRVVASPRPMYMYAFNRAMLQMMHCYVQESVLSMIDVMETLHFGGVQEDIYFVFDVLAEQRGTRDRFRQPFDLACDYLLIGTLCTLRFPAISLSFFWKAKVIFKSAGLRDLEEFAETFIRTQYEILSSSFKDADPEGVEMFREAAAKITAVCKVPSRETCYRPNLVPTYMTKRGVQPTDEQKKIREAVKDYEHHVTTYEDIEAINQLLPQYDANQSMLLKMFKSLDESNPDSLPNIMEVLDVVCYDEERYAIQFGNDQRSLMLFGDVHESEGLIDTVVNPDDKYVYSNQGIIPHVFYRGQTVKKDPCRPSLYRGLTGKQQFVERLKLCEFSILLHKHPSSSFFDEGLTNELNNGAKEHHSLYIDDEALGQHYGIKTQYLDLTTDKWVAAFFACCDYKANPASVRDVYEKHTEETVGVFYEYQASPDYKPDGNLRPIGLQPHSRPVFQAGYVKKLSETDNFNNVAIAIPFRFHSGCTSILYWLFNQSGHIQPPEMIELKAKRIVLEERCFSEAAYEHAHRRYYKDLTDDEFAALVDGYGLESQSTPLVDFAEDELLQADEDRKQLEPYIRMNLRAKQVFCMTYNSDD